MTGFESTRSTVSYIRYTLSDVNKYMKRIGVNWEWFLVVQAILGMYKKN